MLYIRLKIYLIFIWIGYYSFGWIRISIGTDLWAASFLCFWYSQVGLMLTNITWHSTDIMFELKFYWFEMKDFIYEMSRKHSCNNNINMSSKFIFRYIIFDIFIRAVLLVWYKFSRRILPSRLKFSMNFNVTTEMTLYYLFGCEVTFDGRVYLFCLLSFFPSARMTCLGKYVECDEDLLSSYFCDSFSLNPQSCYHFGVSRS